MAIETLNNNDTFGKVKTQKLQFKKIGGGSKEIKPILKFFNVSQFEGKFS